MFSHKTTEEFTLISEHPGISRRTLLLSGYYGVMLLITLLGVSYGYLFSEVFFPR